MTEGIEEVLDDSSIRSRFSPLHNLILCEAAGLVGIHSFGRGTIAADIGVANVAETEGAATILVTGELG